jgi:hypothetical protein
MPIGLALVVVPAQALMLIFTLVFRRHHERAVRRRIIKAAVYLGTLLAAQGLAIAEARSIETLAQQWVTACEAFEKDHGRLPTALSELVPDYRSSVPDMLRGYPLVSGAIYYYTPPDENRPASFTYRLNPDASRSYSFETHHWTPP